MAFAALGPLRVRRRRRVEQEWRLDRLEPVQVIATLCDEISSGRQRAASERTNLAREEQADVAGLLELAASDRPTPDLPDGHPHLLDDADDVGLRALAPGQERRRRCKRRAELRQRLRVVRDHAAD